MTDNQRAGAAGLFILGMLAWGIVLCLITREINYWNFQLPILVGILYRTFFMYTDKDEGT